MTVVVKSKIQEQDREAVKFTILGEITATADLSEIAAQGSHDRLVFDLSDVTSINSQGIRVFKETFDQVKNKEIFFERVPSIMIQQINMVVGMIPAQSIIRSFFVPMYCEASGSESTRLYVLGRDFQSKATPNRESVRDEGNNVFEWDVAPDKYFRFIQRYT